MFIWLQHTGSLVAACELLGHVGSFPDQGLNLGPLHWERGAFAPRLPKKSLISISDVWKLRFGEVRELASGPWKWDPTPPQADFPAPLSGPRHQVGLGWSSLSQPLADSDPDADHTPASRAEPGKEEVRPLNWQTQPAGWSSFPVKGSGPPRSSTDLWAPQAGHSCLYEMLALKLVASCSLILLGTLPQTSRRWG